MSVAVPVRSPDGAALMLKVLDVTAARAEATALRAFPEHASVRCLAHADGLGALLLERLAGPSLLGRSIDEQIVVQAGLARALAVPDPGGLPRLADGQAEHLDRLLGQVPDLLARRVVATAAEAIGDLDSSPVTTLTHGDLHPANVLQDGSARWRAIDPDARVGTVAHESHTVVVDRSRLDELAGRGRAGATELRRRLVLFSDIAGVDTDLATRLCQARAVVSALFEAGRGDRRLASGLGWVAETLAGTPATSEK